MEQPDSLSHVATGSQTNSLWILYINRAKHDLYFSAHSTYEAARAELATYCRHRWMQEFEEEAMPDDNEMIISKYRELMEEKYMYDYDYLEIEQCELNAPKDWSLVD